MTDTEFRELAKEEHEDEGTVEIDDNAVVSRGSSSGAYVQAWVYVYDPRWSVSDDTTDNLAANEPGDFDTFMSRPTADRMLEIITNLIRGIELEGVRFVPGYREAEAFLRKVKDYTNEENRNHTRTHHTG